MESFSISNVSVLDKLVFFLKIYQRVENQHLSFFNKNETL